MAFAILSGIADATTSRPRFIKAHTRFLAASTLIRGTWGMNQNIYLAEISPHTGSEPQLARLIDEYSNLAPLSSDDILTSTVGAVLRIRRDTQCDMPYATMKLRTAPGDPMAILPERLSYQPKFLRTPQPGALSLVTAQCSANR
jgi:hypothetical protein